MLVGAMLSYVLVAEIQFLELKVSCSTGAGLIGTPEDHVVCATVHPAAPVVST